MSRRAVVTGLVIASVAIVAALSDGALAAKKLAKPAPQIAAADPPPLPPAVHNWSGSRYRRERRNSLGCFQSHDIDRLRRHDRTGDDPGFKNSAGHQAGDPLGFGGGVQAGYNWQSGHWLAGIEGDVEYLHLNFPARTYVPFVGNNNTAVMSAYDNANWVASLRPRLGWADGDWLFFLPGGPAVTKYEDEFSIWVVNSSGGDQFWQTSGLRAWRLGYAAGGGVERAIGNNWSVKAEYLHFDFDSATATQVQSTNQHKSSRKAPDSKPTWCGSASISVSAARMPLPRRRGFDSAAQMSSTWNAPDWEIDLGTLAFFSNGLTANPTLSAAPRPMRESARAAPGATSTGSPGKPTAADHSSGFFRTAISAPADCSTASSTTRIFRRTSPIRTPQHRNGSMGYDIGTLAILPNSPAPSSAPLSAIIFSASRSSLRLQPSGGGRICAPPNLTTQIMVSQDIRFNSLRVGLSAEFMLTDRLKFVADAAYVPVVSAVAVDDHNATASYFPEIRIPRVRHHDGGVFGSTSRLIGMSGRRPLLGLEHAPGHRRTHYQALGRECPP